MNKELQYYLQQTFALPGSVIEMQDAENFLADKMQSEKYLPCRTVTILLLPA